MKNKIGHVYLTGAGPGDPDLLTIKAFSVLRTAEVVVYDRLVSDSILKIASKNAIMISVGKECGKSFNSQEEINEILASFAHAGLNVVRLKGGDPFIFGRGGEEACFLKKCGIGFSIIPGVSSANGAAASICIPLTHRGVATSVRYITGHGANNSDLNIKWDTLNDPTCTLVFYMALETAPVIQSKLISCGIDGDTPVALVESGTTSKERYAFSTLNKLGLVAKEFNSPTIIIVGKSISAIQR